MRDRTATQELQLLAARLREIQQDLDPSVTADRDRLLELAEIYAILGEVDDAAVIHQALANQALAVGNEEEFQNPTRNAGKSTNRLVLFRRCRRYLR